VLSWQFPLPKLISCPQEMLRRLATLRNCFKRSRRYSHMLQSDELSCHLTKTWIKGALCLYITLLSIIASGSTGLLVSLGSIGKAVLTSCAPTELFRRDTWSTGWIWDPTDSLRRYTTLPTLAYMGKGLKYLGLSLVTFPWVIDFKYRYLSLKYTSSPIANSLLLLLLSVVCFIQFWATASSYFNYCDTLLRCCR